MTKDVFVRIQGLHVEEEGENPEPVEVICPGTYYKKNDKHYVMYDEVHPEENKVTKNTVKIYDGTYEVIKKGLTNTHLFFQEGKTHTTMYETPFGSLVLDVFTNRISFEEKDNEIKVLVDYELKVNDRKIADCSIDMNVEAKEDNNFSL